MKWLEFKNQANKPAEILIYGEIGDYWDGLDASSLAAAIKGASGDSVTVRLNTPGGSVFTAQAFYSLLRTSGKTVNVYIDGICASAGTIISSAGDNVYMPENAMFMVHNPMTSLYGANAEEMRETADILDKVQETIIAAYRNKTGQSDEKLKELMSKDTYLTAAEAKELGFIDEITSPFAVAATMHGGMLDVNGVKMSAERLKNMPTSFIYVVKSNKNEGVAKVMNKEQLKAEHADLYTAVLAEGAKGVDVAAIEAEAKKAERDRISAIQAAAMSDHGDLVKEAIENNWDAGKFALAALQADKNKGAEYLAKRKADAAALSEVTPSADPAPTISAIDQAFLDEAGIK